MGKGTLRNQDCYCGSGKKYKKCHLLADEGWVATPTGFKSQQQINTERIMEMLAEQAKKNKEAQEKKASGEVVETDQPIENITPAQNTVPPVPAAPGAESPPPLEVRASETILTKDIFGQK